MNYFGICVESSHKKGMGHFFRALNFINLLKSKNERYVVCINNNNNSVAVLRQRKIPFEIVNLEDEETNWESRLIKKYKINIWINDRLDTRSQHARKIKKNHVKLIALDDKGDGSCFTDINFGTLPCNFNYDLVGKKVLKGLDYLILDPEIKQFRRIRKTCKQIVVSLGGSDTYGVTLKVVKILKKHGILATVVTGPCFKHMQELEKLAGKNYPVVSNTDSLAREFWPFDLAITGGGITPFEANASGLPCMIVASELEEIDNGFYLDKLGSSVFAGYHKNINRGLFFKKLDIEKMSRRGIEKIKTDGAENIYREIIRI